MPATRSPRPPAAPGGLSPEVRARLATLAAARAKLYTLFVTVLVLAAATFIIVVIVFPTDGIEARWDWLPGIVGFIVPGLPVTLVGFTAEYPLQVLAFLAVVALIRQASHSVKLAAQEQALQAWRRTATAGAGRATTPQPPVGVWARVVARVVPPRWLSGGAGVALGLLVVFNLLSPQTRIEADMADVASVCADVHGTCRLGSGEAARVTISAARFHNATGLLVEAGVVYTARFVGMEEWRDAEHAPPPTGFRFDRYLPGLTRFWWLEWRRPYPPGRWFEVVGRIDHEPEVFPVLDPEDAGRPFAFTAPSDGELALLVNDVPFANNRGVMTLEIRRPAP